MMSSLRRHDADRVSRSRRRQTRIADGLPIGTYWSVKASRPVSRPTRSAVTLSAYWLHT